MVKTLRFILGDQLNSTHSWFQQTEPETVYVLMEMMQEQTYVKHHIQKILAFFGAMRNFT
ncbi:MAG: cryptochrome/photolyase family protein, partial [Sphingobacteriaceae bacterium]